MTFLCGYMGFLTARWLLPSPNYLKRSRVKLCCLLSPSLGSHIELRALPDSRSRNKDPAPPWEDCQSHIVRNVYEMGDIVVAMFGTYNPPSRSIGKFFLKEHFFNSRYQRFSSDKVSKNSSTRITKYIKFIKKEGMLRKSQQK